MSQARNHLPPVNATSTAHQHAEVTTQLVKQNNRQDAFKVIYAADTGSATAYVMTPTPGIKFYDVGQPYEFKALHANTTATPTLNVNGLGAGTISKQGGAALAVGDIALGDFVTVICTSATPTFQITSQVATPITLSGATTYQLTSSVAISTAPASPTSIINTGSIGASGQVWLIMATLAFVNTGAATVCSGAISNGTGLIAAGEATGPTTNQGEVMSLNAVVTLSAATTFTLLAAANAANTFAIRAFLVNTTFAPSAADKMTNITAVRIA